jgi:hypothetical protein
MTTPAIQVIRYSSMSTMLKGISLTDKTRDNLGGVITFNGLPLQFGQPSTHREVIAQNVAINKLLALVDVASDVLQVGLVIPDIKDSELRKLWAQTVFDARRALEMNVVSSGNSPYNSENNQ